MTQRSGIFCRRALLFGWLQPAFVAGLLTLSPFSSSAQEFRLPPLPVDTFTLSNGLRVIVSEDHSAPVVAVNMWYYVGSAHEETGQSGLAHLFEHMMLQETENLEDGELHSLVTRAGGICNGTTDFDRTEYFEILPSNRLNLALWLHAERMDRLVISEQSFETQREVVKEERRLRIENQPYAVSEHVLDSIGTDWEPYRHPTIGVMEDLDAATTQDARSFYQRFYTPNNAVLAVAGDVTPAMVREMAERYLGPIPRGVDPHGLPPVPPTPRRDGERRAIVDDPLAQVPLLWVAYSIPPASDDDQYALSLLSTVFSAGESSRLHRRLVREERVAPMVASALSRRVGPGFFLFGALPNQGGSVERIEALILEEVERLKGQGITSEELETAKNQHRASEVANRMTVQGKATGLQWYQRHFGDPSRINSDFQGYEEVTVEDVLRVAREYLVDENRSVVLARPAASKARAPEGGGVR